LNDLREVNDVKEIKEVKDRRSARGVWRGRGRGLLNFLYFLNLIYLYS